VAQSVARSDRARRDRDKSPRELTSSIVPRGTSLHRLAGLGYPSVLVTGSCCEGSGSSQDPLLGPVELGAIAPEAVHDDSQPARQSHDGLLQAAPSGHVHSPSLQPRLFLHSGDLDLEAKVAQQTADVILDGMGLLLQQLAGCQRSASALAGQGLHMDGPEQVDAHHLSDAASIVAVGFVHLRLQERFGVARLDADDQQSGRGQPALEPLRHWTGFESDPLEPPSWSPEHLHKVILVTCYLQFKP
jgi:hypothetical protein